MRGSRGIFFNVNAAKERYDAYLNGTLEVELVEGKMLHYLLKFGHDLSEEIKAENKRFAKMWAPGKEGLGGHKQNYDDVQQYKGYNVWLFQSGHWDLRDIHVDLYMDNLELAFKRLAAFRDRNPEVLVVWSGVPPYAYQRGKLGDKAEDKER